MVERLERLAGRRPAAYRYRVAAAGLLGYAALAFVLALVGGVAAFFVILAFYHRVAVALDIKIALVLGGTSLALVRALWIPAAVPEGLELHEEDAPRLFALVRQIAAASHGMRIDEIRLTGEFNAAITQDVRMILFGSRNRLYVGLPLLWGLDTREFEAVVAHEFGHFAGRHGHWAAFAYRVRLRWAQVAERLPGGVVAAGLRRFFGWYGPWFAAYSFVLARRQEYEADTLSAELVGPEASGDALVRVTVQSIAVATAWSEIWQDATWRPEPPASPHRRLAAALIAERPEDGERLAAALASTPDPQDTHPTLRQRLEALACPPRLPPALVNAAAPAMLGASCEPLGDALDADWREEVAPYWRELYDERRSREAARLELGRAVAEGTASRDELYRHALLVEEIDGPGAAVGAYDAVLARDPDAQEARYRKGECLLALGDEAGLAELGAAAEAEWSLAPYAHERIVAYLTDTGRENDAQRYGNLLLRAEELYARAHAETRTLEENVALEPLHLGPEDRRRLEAAVASLAGVRELHAASRRLRSVDRQQIVFVFKPAEPAEGEIVLDAIMDVVLPFGDAIGIAESHRRAWLTRRIKALPDSQLLPPPDDSR